MKTIHDSLMRKLFFVVVVSLHLDIFILFMQNDMHSGIGLTHRKLNGNRTRYTHPVNLAHYLINRTNRNQMNE